MVSTLPPALLARPTVALGTLCCAQIVLWTMAPSISHDAPPLDVVEGYLWGTEHVIGTYKHPALPSWLLEASRTLTGATGWPAYLISQIAIALTFVSVYLLGCAGFASDGSSAGRNAASRTMRGSPEELALAGTLLLTAVFYFSWPTPEFNHNIAQMPCWAGLSYALWRASSQPVLQTTLADRLRSVGWWIAVGLIGALGIYAKFSTALLLLAATAWILLDERARGHLRRPGPWLGLGVFLLAVAPLWLWLLRTDFLPLTYAVDRGNRFGEPALTFLAEQLLAVAAVIVVLWLSGLLTVRTARPAPSMASRGGLWARLADRVERRMSRADARFVRYLALMTLAPVLLTVVGALVSGVGVKGMWGVPMLNLVGLIAVALCRDRFGDAALRAILIAAAFLVLAVPLAYAITTLAAPQVATKLKRQNWPQAEIASRMRTLWTSATGQPLRIVAGDNSNWVSGLVALGRGRMPSLFTNGDTVISPWITKERVAAEGVLIVWQELGRGPPENLVQLVGTLPLRQERFRLPRSRSTEPLIIGYAIIPPSSAAPVKSARQ